MTTVSALFLFSKKSIDEALQGFENVLATKPTNILALLGKVCLNCNYFDLALI